MKRNITVFLDRNVPAEELDMEIVERKGKGHPDYIADGIAEAVSLALCHYYLDNYGRIFHHNVDKSLVVGGRSIVWFGGGEVIEPIELIVAGRATTEIVTEKGHEYVPLGSLVLNAIKGFIRENFRFLNPDEHVTIQYKIRPGSQDLRILLESGSKIPDANDTSVGVAFAPLTITEKLVFETERFLNSPELKKKLPEVGEDIKVMGLRVNKEIKLTIAAAMISKLIPDKDHYQSVKEEVRERIEDLASKLTDMPVKVYVNTADKPEKDAYYITVTGTSAEGGDDGNAGRGNRVNGLITPFRPMSMEATAGKNPINHVGKIYNVIAKDIANKIYNEVKGVKNVTVRLLSQIGRPIDQPLNASAYVSVEKGINFNNIKGDIEGIIDEELSNITKITYEIIERKKLLF